MLNGFFASYNKYRIQLSNDQKNECLTHFKGYLVEMIFLLNWKKVPQSSDKSNSTFIKPRANEDYDEINE